MTVRFGGAAIVQAAVALLLAAVGAAAQVVPSAPSQSAQQKMVGYIAADSAPYRIEWTGSGGYFVQHAFGTMPAKRIPLNYIHTQAGPTGYSKHLAWFLARDVDSFNILWLYLDDAGIDFGCWLYQYPSNSLTYQRFTGNYRFTPPTEAPAPDPQEGMSLAPPPRYSGPDFHFQDWSRDVGTLDRLPLYVPPPVGPIVGAAVAPPAALRNRLPDRVLSALRVTPLHEVRVGDANGWKNGGWQELHTIAFDTADDPYYIILYSNEPTGFVVDIRHSRIYTADFGSPVQFAADSPGSTKLDHSEGQGALHVRRYDWHDFALRSAQAHTNPYTQIDVLGEFVGPDGRRVLVPGYWDGEGRWSLRFSPGLVGDWHWRARSSDPDLDGQEGSFECVAVDGKERAFFGADRDRSYRRHFSTQEGAPVFPVALHEPVFAVSPAELRANGPAPPAAQASREAALPASFLAFRKRVEACAALGVNRFVGGFLFDRDASGTRMAVNEGGSLFLNNDLDHPNPEFFHWMDRRIALCNEHGIVPDIGFCWPSTGLLQSAGDVQLRRFWLSVLARYASMDVSWNLFGDDGRAPVLGGDARIAAFAELTRLYDPGHHSITVMQNGAITAGPSVIEDAGALGTAVRKLPPATGPAPAILPSADYPWLDYITLVGDHTAGLGLYDNIEKPVVVWQNTGLPVKEEAVSPDITRRWMWETRMRNFYWVGAASAGAPADSPDVKMTLDCAALFRQTRWWRMTPHPEMLTGREETPAEKRRRRKTEEAALKAAGVEAPAGAGDAGSADPKPSGPLFLLADPGREYVAYLERGGHITLDLLDMPGHIRFVWFNPRTGASREMPDLEGGDYTTLVAPDNEDWVIHLTRH